MNEKEPKSAEILAALLQKSSKATFTSVAKGVTVRLPLLDLAYVEAMAKVSGDPRNKVMSFLIRAGIDATQEHLDEETLKRIDLAQRLYLQENACDMDLSILNSEEKE